MSCIGLDSYLSRHFCAAGCGELCLFGWYERRLGRETQYVAIGTIFELETLMNIDSSL